MAIARRLSADPLEALRAELDEVRGRVALLERRLTRPTGDDPADVRLLDVIRSTTSGHAFTVKELMAHARVVEALATALRDADLTSARQAGKWLCRQARRLDGAIVRVGSDRAGAVWRASFARIEQETREG